MRRAEAKNRAVLGSWRSWVVRLAERVDQSEVMAVCQDELGDMQAAARERRVTLVAVGLKKTDDMEKPGDSGKGSK